MVARFIGGVGVGIATVASPLYISEISPPSMRGRLAGMFQFNIVFGILIAFVSNYFLGKHVSETVAWRWMLGVEAFPALLYTILCFRIPESPRWLIVHGGQRDAGAEVFRKINPTLSEPEITELVETVSASVGDKATAAKFWTARLRIPILLAILIAAFNQLSGINAILYFAPRLLGLAGISDPLKASVNIGLTNLVFTFVGLWLIDKLGRRTLLYIGSLGYIASLAVCAFFFLTYPAFRVVSTAIDVEKSAGQMLRFVLSGDDKDALRKVIDVPEAAFSDADRDAIRKAIDHPEAVLSVAAKEAVRKVIDGPDAVLSAADEKTVRQVLGEHEVVLPVPVQDKTREDYDKAKKSLLAATRLEDYAGEAVDVPDDMDPEGVAARATKAKDEAASILGPKKFVVLFSIMAFIAAHAIGQGAVIWVFISEIFPNRNRAAGQALGSFTHWLFAASITLVFPIAIGTFDAGVLFAFFCAMMCLQLIWVKFMVPETKGVPLEEIQKKLGIL
jgi:MFS family permease